MKKFTISELEVMLHGPDALRRAEAEVKKAEEVGNEFASKRALEKLEGIKQKLDLDERERVRKKGISPEYIDLFGGLTNLKLPVDSFQICEGVRLEPVFVQVMAPYILAFSPAEEGKPNPGPWKSAGGGVGYEVTTQIILKNNSRPTNFDRLNTIWWVASLFRLLHSTGTRVPVVSDTSLNSAGEALIDPMFWPMEIEKSGIAFDGYRPEFVVPEDSLNWIRDHFKSSAHQMEDRKFNLAFSAFQSAQLVSSPAESLILLWSSIEALFRPGKNNLTHRLSLAIATFLENDLSTRDRQYSHVKKLYDVRGQVTHAAEPPEIRNVIATFSLAQRCFIKAIETEKTPVLNDLVSKWKLRSP